MSLAQRRNDCLDKLTELKRQRGVAVNSGKTDFDQSAIAALEVELESLADAEHEKVRKERADASDQHKATRKKMQVELRGLEADRLAAIQDCNVAFRVAAEKIGRILITSRKMTEVAHALSGQPAPIPLTEPDLTSRLGSRISAIMSGIDGHRNRLGPVEWRGASRFMAADDWRASEKQIMEGHLSPLTEEGTKDNG